MFFIIAAGKILFQPDVHTYEQISAPHLLDLELCHPRPAVAPGNGNDCPTVASNDGLERNLDRKVEVRGDERPAAVDNFPAIGLEGVGGVVELDPEEHLEELVGKPVD